MRGFLPRIGKPFFIRCMIRVRMKEAKGAGDVGFACQTVYRHGSKANGSARPGTLPL
jgi:hypothetical protein